MNEAHTDILVIGGGPAGLHAAFYAGWRGLSVRLLEARGEVGGQLSALYPDKRVYDVPGLPGTRAAEVVAHLVAQLDGLNADIRLNELARTLTPHEHGWQVSTENHTFTAGAVILAAGLGALRPREARMPGSQQHPDVRRDVPDFDLPQGERWKNRRVLVIGGVPQATRAARELAERGARVTLTHRRSGFRGEPETLSWLERASTEGGVDVLAPAEVLRLLPNGAELSVGGQTCQIPADTVFALGGYLPDLSPVLAWPLNWQGEYVPDGPGGRTALEGVYVVGDLALSGGDFKLISLAFSQSALAANHAAAFVRPELKARPGHSSEKRG